MAHPVPAQVHPQYDTQDAYYCRNTPATCRSRRHVPSSYWSSAYAPSSVTSRSAGSPISWAAAMPCSFH